VFNIRYIENRENAKYSTKNNKREVAEVFLARKNQERARTISISILTLIAAIRYIVRPAGSFASPLLKMDRIVRLIAKKHRISINRSYRVRAIFRIGIERYPAMKSRQLSKINLRIVFLKITREFRII
jgi:hypothetical protein